MKTAAIFLTAAFALGLSLAAGIAQARDLEKREGFAPGGTLRVNNLAGEVVISGWDKDEIYLVAKLGERIERVEFEVVDNEAVIEIIYEDRDDDEHDHDRGRKYWRNQHDGEYESDLEIYVPNNTTVEAETVSADIELTGIAGDQSLETVSGDIKTTFEPARIDLAAISGDIDAVGRGDGHSINLSLVSGDADIFNVSGNIRGSVVSGDLQVTGPAIARAELTTVSGSLALEAGLAGDAQVKVDSVSGDVRLGLQDPVSAKFDLQTFSGDIDEFFGHTAERTSRYAPGRRLRFTEGNGDATVRVNTMSGDIESAQ